MDNKDINHDEIKRLRELEGLSNNEVKKIKEFSKVVKGMCEKVKYNLETYSDLLFDYKKILEKTNILA